jgi:serine O-acetyltransferase
MDKVIKLRAGGVIDLANYVAKQLHNMFPSDGIKYDLAAMMEVLPRTLLRMRPILNSVRTFDPDIFNHFNSLQYATFLYLLGNEFSKIETSSLIADRLFCLNRSLNAIDLFYSVEMPEIFFISHGIGSVLGNVTYGNRLVFFHNVTVGRVGEHRPTIGENVVLYPGATITGGSKIGNNCVVSAGAVVHNICVPDNVVVIPQGSKLVFKPLKRDYLSLYLRLNVNVS